MLIKRYQPGTSSYAKRRTDDEWDEHRHLLTRLHNQHYTRKQMLLQLKDQGFQVTSGQLLAQMKKWDLMVQNQHRHIQEQQSDAKNAQEVPSFNQILSTHKSGVRPSTADDYDLDLRDAGFMGGLRLTNSSSEESESYISAYSTTGDTESTTHTSLDLDFNIPESSPSITQFFLSPDPLPMQQPETPPLWCLTDATSILEQLPTILEPWCARFPLACYCNKLFYCTNQYAHSPDLYRVLLRQARSTSIQYAWALLTLAEMNITDSAEESFRQKLKDTVERYLRLCTDPNTKNRQASVILHRLLALWSRIEDVSVVLPGVVWRARSNSNVFRRVFRHKIPDKRIDKVKAFDWESKSECDVNTIIGFTASNPSLFPLINWSGSLFGSMEKWSTVRKEDDMNDLITIAVGLSRYIQTRWNDGPRNACARMTEGCHLPTVFNALGLMMALELDQYPRDLILRDGIVIEEGCWPDELKSFIHTTINTLSLNQEYADKFRKCYWLGRTSIIGFAGKTVHFGFCAQQHEWAILNSDIHDYNEPRTWIEKRLFSNPTSWPQPEDLAESDQMSIKSTSSLNSFRRFQALALHLKLGTPQSRGSFRSSMRSKSTKSKMSLDSHLSWQLEHLLDIKEEEVDMRSLPEHAAIDEEVFQETQIKPVQSVIRRKAAPAVTTTERSSQTQTTRSESAIRRKPHVVVHERVIDQVQLRPSQSLIRRKAVPMKDVPAF